MKQDLSSIYPVNVRKYSDKASVNTPGEYLEIPISDDVEDLGLTQGDELYMVLDRGDSDSKGYLRISPNEFEGVGRVHRLSLKRNEAASPSYAVSVPTEYSVHRDDSPFQGLKQGDTVIVEIDGDAQVVSVYVPDDYQTRLEHLVENDATPDIRVPATLSGLYRWLDTGKVASKEATLRLSAVHAESKELIQVSSIEVRDMNDRLVRTLTGSKEYKIRVAPGNYKITPHSIDYDCYESLVKAESGRVCMMSFRLDPV